MHNRRKSLAVVGVLTVAVGILALFAAPAAADGTGDSACGPSWEYECWLVDGMNSCGSIGTIQCGSGTRVTIPDTGLFAQGLAYACWYYNCQHELVLNWLKNNGMYCCSSHCECLSQPPGI